LTDHHTSPRQRKRKGMICASQSSGTLSLTKRTESAISSSSVATGFDYGRSGL
jgi:hypothetical protein